MVVMPLLTCAERQRVEYASAAFIHEGASAVPVPIKLLCLLVGKVT